MSSVLFDNPGPRAVARNRVIGAVVVLVLVALLAFVLWRFAESGQFSSAKWRAFGYPLVWQSIGGQQLGSIWGHGALVAPDWSADWLHRESLAMLELNARRTFGNAYERLPPRDQGTLQADLKAQLRTNTYDVSRDEIVISDRRAQALAQVSAHYDSLFSNDPATAALRESYAIRNDTVPDAAHRRALASFFFWTSWASATAISRASRART